MSSPTCVSDCERDNFSPHFVFHHVPINPLTRPKNHKHLTPSRAGVATALPDFGTPSPPHSLSSIHSELLDGIVKISK
jgi:hypothetical protein